MIQVSFYLKSGQVITFRCEQFTLKEQEGTHRLESWEAQNIDRSGEIPSHVPIEMIAAITVTEELQ